MAELPHSVSVLEVMPVVFMYGEPSVFGNVAFENDEGEVFGEDARDSRAEGGGSESAIRIPPFRHVGEVYVAEIDATSGIWVSVCIEMGVCVDAGEEYPSAGEDPFAP